jgi:hypothetical protein
MLWPGAGPAEDVLAVCNKIASEAIINACMGHERVDERVERLRHEETLSASKSEARVEREHAEKRPSLVSSLVLLPPRHATLLPTRSIVSHVHGLNPGGLPNSA